MISLTKSGRATTLVLTWPDGLQRVEISPGFFSEDPASVMCLLSEWNRAWSTSEATLKSESCERD